MAALILGLSFNAIAQSVKPNALLKKTEKALKDIKTLTYKIHRTDKYFATKDTLTRSAVGTIKIISDDEMGAYHKIYYKHDDKKYNQYKYDGTYSSFLYFNSDSLNVPKKLFIENVVSDNYNTMKGSFIRNFLLNDYFKKQNVFKQYRSILAKFLLKDITTEESTHNGTPVYVLTVYGKDKPRENRINSSVDKYYIRKTDFLPIAHSFYGEFQGMKQTEFTEIEYLEMNPDISLETFRIDPLVKEIEPKAYFEELQKYNL